MKKMTLVLVFIFSLNIYSQSDFNSKDYAVAYNDLQNNTYEKDSTANALVIYEYGNSYVEQQDFELKTEIKRKIKILNKEGFNKANMTIYLYNNGSTKETVKNIIATTYNLVDNKISTTKLDKSNIFEDKYDENRTLIKFTLPNIKEGSVITYSYTLSSPFMFNYKGWSFQEDVPKLYSEYNTSIPGNWHYNIKLVGGKKLSTNESVLKNNCLDGGRGAYADCTVSIYAMENIPAFIEEDYMTTKNDYLARIEYELNTFQGFDGTVKPYAKTWETVDKELKTDQNIGRQLIKSVDTDVLLSSNILEETDTLKKAKLIYSFIQENYTWNEEYQIFKDVSVKDLIKNKSGNVSSINILLHNLLQDSGIDVNPVLLSTRNNGLATKIFPVISEFNYLIVKTTINNKTYLLDATDKYLSFGEIPFRCLTEYARVLDFKNGSDWMDIELDNTSTVQYRVDLNLDDKQHISGSLLAKKTGYHALNSRKDYYPNKEAYIKKIHDKNPYKEISNHQVLSEGETSSDFIESYDVEYESTESGDNIYLNPFLIKFFNENPFKLQERTYPIDFGYKDSYFYALKLNFSDAYTILEKPKDLVLSIPNNKGQLFFSSVAIGNSIMISFKINFKEAIYQPEYYPYLKEFMSKIVDIQTNSLILIKKK
ncbi:uncharacterized protein DUF3857 [Mariniflexile fucanivorans]|uniref:Uncharacterized protein DUF3857 n=2 Tax=Mariniflexile fucanivorans TaxID=264023 RepID=A0A4R1RNU3_9FLAO|nr:uncharacterized protein DUF3857 [Mariniflexile fucanivorans]